MTQRILSEKKGYAGVITLNRPDALNALSREMLRQMSATLSQWEDDDAVHHVIVKANPGRAFCAGGDIKQLHEWLLAQDERFLEFYRQEYRLNAQVQSYSKPYIALMDGIVMGGGAGISVNGRYRLGGDRLTFAMPETGIGLFPDVGATWFLPRCPGKIGLYLGLTGARLGIADALYAGLMTHHIPSEQFAAVEKALCATDDIDDALERFANPAGASELAEQRPAIDRCFGASNLKGVMERLRAGETPWHRQTLDLLETPSPTSLAITFEQLRRGTQATSFADCIRLEYRIVSRIFAGHDFAEGVRAAVIEKDRRPQWRPKRLEDIADADIEAYFAPLAQELDLPHATTISNPGR